MDKKLNVLIEGPVATKSGYGAHARQIMECLSIIPWINLGVLPTAWGQLSWYNFDDFKYETLKQFARIGNDMKNNVDVHLQVTIPKEFQPKGVFSIGVTAGLETDRVPLDYIDGCNRMDFIVVPSEHALNSLANVEYDMQDRNTGRQFTKRVNVPVKIIPEFVHKEFFSKACIDESGIDGIKEIAQISKTDKKTPKMKEFLESIDTNFNFLINGLWGHPGPDADRKNIHTTIQLFLESFVGEKDVGMIAKVSSGPPTAWDFWETTHRINHVKEHVSSNLKVPIDSLPPVYLLHGWFSDYDMHHLYFSEKVKVMVNLGREGYGLPLLEAAMAGIPVIAMDWSGHKDFLGDSFIKIPHKIDKVPKTACSYGIQEDFQWAYPDKNEVKRAMRRIREKYVLPKEKAIALANSEKIVNLNMQDIGKQYAKLIEPALELKYDNAFGIISKSMIRIFKEVKELKKDGSKVMLVNMPMSAGDVLMIMHLLGKLKEKYEKYKLIFATSKNYFNIVEGCPHIDKVVEYQNDFDNHNLTRGIFDKVYSPHFATQHLISQPLSKERNIVEEYAAYLNVDYGDFPRGCWLPECKDEDKREYGEHFIVLSAQSKPARSYKYWEEIVENVKGLGINVVQVGEGNLIKGTVDVRNAPYSETVDAIRRSDALVSVDTFHAWVANVLGIPHVTIFGSSIPKYTGTFDGPRHVDHMINRRHIETPVECPIRPCYKDMCANGMMCLNGIDPKDIFDSLCDIMFPPKVSSVDGDDFKVAKLIAPEFKPKIPSISGYTTVFNCLKAKIPFEQCIISMTEWCDEVVVVDGMSSDGTFEAVEKLAKDNDKIQIYQREFDMDEPGMDGQQKSFARALCTKDILVNMDADELFSEEDYDKIKKLSRDLYFSDEKILCLPVIELWGNLKHATGRRHIWKWRVSKNDPEICHGIPDQDRAIHDKTGKVYSKGNSDGCFYINMSTNQMIPASNFYSEEMDQIRQQSPEGFTEISNKAFEQLPSVWHTSWLNLGNKIDQFRTFWHKMWCSLYQKDINKEPNRFDVSKPWDYEFTVEEKEIIANAMYKTGGEASDSIKYKFKIERKPPRILEEWHKSPKDN